MSSVGFEAAITFNCAPHHAKSSPFLAGGAEGGSCLLLKRGAESAFGLFTSVSHFREIQLQQWQKVFYTLRVHADGVPGSRSVLVFSLRTHSLLISPQKGNNVFV